MVVAKAANQFETEQDSERSQQQPQEERLPRMRLKRGGF
jgi:hypothetical protein